MQHFDGKRRDSRSRYNFGAHAAFYFAKKYVTHIF